MNNLVQIKNNALCVCSKGGLDNGLAIANRSIIKLIEKHITSFEEFGIIAFEMLLKETRGKPEKIVYLNEDQCLFLLTLCRNSDKAVKLKKRLVKDFMAMRKFIAQKIFNSNDPTWIAAREQAIKKRKSFCDSLHDGFIKYCISQGSKNAERYYTSITKCINIHLFEFPIGVKLKSIRDFLDKDQLARLSLIEEMCINKLMEYMDSGLDYHDVFQYVKADIKTMASLLGKSKIDIPTIPKLPFFGEVHS